jgi:hypothetical protein
MDIDSILDVTSYAGVNLTHEEEQLADLYALQGSTSKEENYTKDRIRQQSFMNLPSLKQLIQSVAQENNVKKVEQEYVNMVALAAQDYCRRLLRKMIVSSKHRTLLLHSHFLREDKKSLLVDRLDPDNSEEPVDINVNIKDDIKSVLSQLEKAEVEDERELRAERAQALGMD